MSEAGREPLPAAGTARSRLLEQLRQRKLGAEESGIARLPAGARAPLSSAQARLWFLEQLHPGSAQYNIGTALRFRAQLEPATLAGALSALMERHHALRLRIAAEDGEPFQVESVGLMPLVEWHDLRRRSVVEAQSLAAELSATAARASFHLGSAPLFRVSAVRLPEDETLLVIIFHHIIADGWSLGIFFEELAALLSGDSLAPPPPVRFIDYVSWQQTAAREADYTRQLDYWRAKLGGDLPVLDLPRDRPRPVLPTLEGRLLEFSVPAATTEQLRRFAAEAGATLFIVLLAAYKALLFRLTGQSDIVVGTPFAGREHPAAERLIGFFVNTLALRTDLGGSPSFREVVRRVRATTLEAQDHRSVPFERVVEALSGPRELQHNPIFQTLFALQNTPRASLRIAGVDIHAFDLDTGTAKFDLTLSLTEQEPGLMGLAEYSSELFDEASIRRYVNAYLQLLDSLLSAPDLPIRRHDLLSAAEKEQIIYGLNAPTQIDARHRTLAEPFEEQARRTPEAVALVGDEGQLTYLELNTRANQLAHYLRRQGVRRGDFVAVCMERSLTMVVALYAIAKAGAAYVPLDTELPGNRLAFMLQDAGARLVLTHALAAAKLPTGPWTLVSVDEAAPELASEPVTNLPHEGPTHQVAYLLYTSGSTGLPKGVAYPVDASVSFLLWMQERYSIGPDDAALLKTPYGFDVSVWELFCSLYAGARLVVCRPDGHRDPAYLAETIERHAVTMVNFVPSMLRAFLDEKSLADCHSLRLVFSAGEALTPLLRDAFHARLGARLVNLYGPTEAGAVCDHIFDPTDLTPTIPIGKPAAGFRLHILDGEIAPTPVGVPGELYIGADVGLAHGYHKRPELTAEQFVPDPFSRQPGARLYRTGDICRYLPDGAIEYLGRRDTQIKLRGVRVELSEIEEVLGEHEAVAASVVLVSSEGDQQRLLAFVTLRPGARATPDELAQHVEQFLPRFMLPAAIIPIDRLPTTINGKVDREALLRRWHEAAPQPHAAMVPPADECEARLASVFAQALGIASVGVTENFFDLGGHSLLVLKLIAGCEREFGRRPAVAQVFAAPSVRGLAPLLRAPAPDKGSVLVALAPRLGKPVLLFVHAASGSALPFVEVVQHLRADFSLYGFQAPGLDDDEPPLASIEAFAAHYAPFVEQFARSAPVFLAGWSLGGNIVVEMARQLRARDILIAGTLVIDSWAASEPDSESTLQEEAEHAMAFLRHEGLAPPDMPEPALTRMLRVLEASIGAFRRHTPARYDGPVDVLQAVEPFPQAAGAVPSAYMLPDRGWGDIASRVVAHPVAGHHFNLMTGDHARALAGVIRAIAATRRAVPTA
ncbi:MAG TPA: amino acid adenylation domain-containing protein [Pyrinomonadaceae bacterium]